MAALSSTSCCSIGLGTLAATGAEVRVRELLEQEGLKPWPKLTGGKGIHAMAPLPEKLGHDAVRVLARNLVQKLASTDARRYTTSADPAARTNRIYLDYLRNGRGNTAVGAYSPRAPRLPHRGTGELERGRTRHSA